MRVLEFAAREPGERVREPVWRERSFLAIDQVCAMANAVREQVATHFGPGIEVWVHEPVPAHPALISSLTAEAEIFEVATVAGGRGWLVVDSHAARRLVAAAFAEREPLGHCPWSPLERQTLLGIMRDLAACCTVLFGPVREVAATGDEFLPTRAKTVIALRFAAPLDIEVDVVLMNEPATRSQAMLSPEALKEAAVTVRAIAGTLRVSFSDLATLQIGAVLPMSKEGRARLMVDRTAIAFGACGVTGGRLAFRIGTVCESQGA